MALTTQQKIDAITAAIGRGLLEIRDGTDVLRYQTVDDMLAARNALVWILKSETNPNRATPRYQLADFRDDRDG